MNAPLKLAGFAAALALLAGGGWAVGAVAGPEVEAEPEPMASHTASGEATGSSEHGGGHDEEAKPPGGLAVSEGGYTFAPVDVTLPARRATSFAFRILGPKGTPITRFDVEHEKRMHLIVVRRDTSGFQHIHPVMAADGTWRVPIRLPRAGSYRAYADFTPSGAESLTLGVDLSVPGGYRPAVYDHESRTASVDGYRVRLDGDLVAGRSSKLTLTVERRGAPVKDLQPYLGAYGHLVALREGDLAYLHVHPDGEPGDGKTRPGPTVTFFAEVPSEGTYRLFLDFRHLGEVRTAEFTVVVGGHGAGPSPKGTGHGHGD
ncbi:MAG: hypothetical protein GEV10_22755 [Streptosporangiales bacterium]|nr:hypothetical protein [Streptosporangiales bacterium]